LLDKPLVVGEGAAGSALSAAVLSGLSPD